MSDSRARGGGSAGGGGREHLNQSMGGDADADMTWEAYESQRSLEHNSRVKVEDAQAYLARVKSQYEGEPAIYIRFLDAMKEFKAQTIDTNEVIGRAVALLSGRKALILGFNPFLPPGYKIEVEENARGMLSVRFSHPGGVSELLTQQKAADDDRH